MKLFIDTSNSEKISVKLDDKVYEANSIREKSQALLPFLIETLKSTGHTLRDIEEVSFNSGPGSFTGLRVGAAVANALSWSLNIPHYFTQLNYKKG